LKRRSCGGSTRCPAQTRSVMLIAAADPAGDPLVLWRAARLIGIDTSVIAAGETDGLMEIAAQVRFRHPLVRSAVYRAASPQERRAVHLALAEATDREHDPDRGTAHRDGGVRNAGLPSSWPQCHSSVRALRNNIVAISGLVNPSRASRAICSSCGVSFSREWTLRFRAFTSPPPQGISETRRQLASRLAYGATQERAQTNVNLKHRIAWI